MKNIAHNLENVIKRTITLAVLATSMTFTATAIAADSENLAYVDSVQQWGAWGLDIEPAAGGLPPQAMQPLNARATKVSLRTNSISALSPSVPRQATTVAAIPSMPAPMPAPTAPVIPPAPAPAPAPTVPPVGGPADGLF